MANVKIQNVHNGLWASVNDDWVYCNAQESAATVFDMQSAGAGKYTFRTGNSLYLSYHAVSHSLEMEENEATPWFVPQVGRNIWVLNTNNEFAGITADNNELYLDKDYKPTSDMCRFVIKDI